MTTQEQSKFEKLYLKHKQYIEHLIQEAATLKEKFGERSQLYQSKIKSIQFVTHFHDETINYLQNMERAFITLQMNYTTHRTMMMANLTGMSLSEYLAKVDKGNEEGKLKLDECNRIMERLKQHTIEDNDLLIDRLQKIA